MPVGSEIPAGLDRMLSEANAKVRHVSDGQAAIACAQHEMFDAVLLISTGDEMDLAETMFNLSDVNGAGELIILSDQTDTMNSAIPKEALAELVSSASVMTTEEFHGRIT